MIFSLQVNKTIKSNREIINGFLGSFEYIKLKIGKEEEEEEKRQNKKKKKESIKQETNCSSLQIDIVRINEIKGKTRTVQMKKKNSTILYLYTPNAFFPKHTQNLSHSKTKIQIEEESFFFICSSY